MNTEHIDKTSNTLDKHSTQQRTLWTKQNTEHITKHSGQNRTQNRTQWTNQNTVHITEHSTHHRTQWTKFKRQYLSQNTVDER